MTRLATLARPETVHEAREFTTRRYRYDRLGLCPTCAAQAAYAHCHGGNAVASPCTSCEPIVQTFPRARNNGWRLVLEDDEPENAALTRRTNNLGVHRSSRPVLRLIVRQAELEEGRWEH